MRCKLTKQKQKRSDGSNKKFKLSNYIKAVKIQLENQQVWKVELECLSRTKLQVTEQTLLRAKKTKLQRLKTAKKHLDFINEKVKIIKTNM